jgi:chemotaxis signal transduction protein
MDRQISTWAGMSFLTLKGAFMHTSNKTVFVVDTERLATGGRTVAFAPPATVKQVSESGKVMAHTDTLYKTIRMVILYAGKVQAALPLSAIRFVSTVRSAHIHQVQMDNNLIIGILERSGVFSSVLDLGVLLESDPIPLTPGARLISVESDSGKVVLLATEFGEPEEIQEDKIHPWNIETDPKSKFRPDKAFTLNDGRKVPILDASKVISAAQGQRHE